MKEGFNGQQLIRMPESMKGMLGQEEILSALCIYAIGYFPYAANHYIKRPHGMKGAEGQYLLNYIVEGEGWCEIEGKRYDVKANQFFIFPMNKPHAYGSVQGKKWTVYWVRFGGSLASYYSAGFEKPTTVKVGVTSRIRFRQNTFEEMYNVLDKGFTLDSLCYASSLLFTYLGSFMFLNTYRNSMTNTTIDVTNKFSLLQELTHFMQERLEERLTLKEISDYSGYSVTQISDIFRKNTGYAPMAYFNIMKMQHACWLLTHTTLKINQICYKSGIEDPYYFSRLFKKIIGVSPQSYRENNRSANTSFLPIMFM